MKQQFVRCIYFLLSLVLMGQVHANGQIKAINGIPISNTPQDIYINSGFNVPIISGVCTSPLPSGGNFLTWTQGGVTFVGALAVKCNPDGTFATKFDLQKGIVNLGAITINLAGGLDSTGKLQVQSSAAANIKVAQFCELGIGFSGNRLARVLNLRLQPCADDNGLPANTYLMAEFQGSLYFFGLPSPTNFVVIPYQSGPLPIFVSLKSFDNQTSPINMNLNLGNITALAGMNIYFGYGVDANDMLTRHTYALLATYDGS